MVRLGGLVFAPARWPTVATLLLLPLLVVLGIWQLGRAGEKDALHEQYRMRMSATAVAADPTMFADPAASRFKRVRLQGRFDLERQFILDNRTSQGRAGVEVFTPLRGAENQPVVLVNRGWVPWGSAQGRGSLPSVMVASTGQNMAVEGLISLPPRPGPLLGEDGYDNPDWPKLVQVIDMDRIADLLDRPVVPAVLLLDVDQPGGYHRNWRSFSGISPDRHRGYALQWFSLAVALLVIYVVVNTRRLGGKSRTD